MSSTGKTISLIVSLLAVPVGADTVCLRAADQPPPYNIILITPDQLRADFIHTYGYPLPDTPNIDQLASQGTLFLRAYSAGSWTTPSFGALFTGLFPTVHGMAVPPFLGCGPSITHPMMQGEMPDVPSFVNLSPDKPILSEILKAHGMTTAADNANCWSSFDLIHRGWDSFKFFPGFQLRSPEHPYWGDPQYITAPATLAWAKQWLTTHRDQRFFLWVHFIEPHSPYNAPREYDRFGNPEDFPDLYEDTQQGRAQLHFLANQGNAHAIRRLEQLYAAKILFVDGYIGELIKAIHGLGLDDKTIVILLSDHGELLYSHPEDYNTADHISLYDADAHIPLIVRGPGIRPGRRVSTLVSHYDVLPTILDLESFPRQPNVDGASFKQVFSNTSPLQVHDYLYGEQLDLVPEFSVRNERYKLIESLPEGKIACFDHLVDPEESHSICGKIPQTAANLKKSLDAHIQTDIREAKSYADWEDNLALAVVEQRDSKGLLLLAPREEIVGPGAGNSEFQLDGRGLWSASTDSRNCEAGLCYWAPSGDGSASVTWRSEMPLTGDYQIYFKYGGSVKPERPLATNASLLVQFRGGTLAIPIDENVNEGKWNLLGRFDHPRYVKLTNLADGPVVAGAIRFLRVEKKQQ